MPKGLEQAPGAPAHFDPNAPYVDTESRIQGLSTEQITVLAQKVMALWRDELRIEDERHGRIPYR